MNRLLDIMAKTLSVLLYPLFVPTYGMIIFCVAFSAHVAPLPSVWTAIAVLGTLLLTCVIPVTAIWIMVRKGEIEDMQIENPEQRTIPYLYAALGFCFWCYLVFSVLKAPVFLSFIAAGATAAIALVALINRGWKISAHLTGMGGLTGGLITYCLGIGAIPTGMTLVLWLALSWLLMMARIRLNAHTPAQVSAGWLLGITCTFLPYCIYSYAL